MSKGVIEAKSEKTKGVKIRQEEENVGQWFNGKDVWKFAENLEKGVEVEFGIDGKFNLVFIKPVEKASSQPPPAKPLTKEEREIHLTPENIRVGALETARIFEQLVPEKLIELAKRFEKYIKTGE